MWMPRTDGMGVLDRLKRGKTRPKVIVMTSDDAPETLLKAIRQQAHQYVRKPVEPATLVALVRDVLKSSHEPPIEVVSARPDWVELAVPCTREAADRLHDVMARLETNLPEDVRESVSYAFRELLMNAVEWGGKLDLKRKVKISYPPHETSAALSHRRPRARIQDGRARPRRHQPSRQSHRTHAVRENRVCARAGSAF